MVMYIHASHAHVLKVVTSIQIHEPSPPDISTTASLKLSSTALNSYSPTDMSSFWSNNIDVNECRLANEFFQFEATTIHE